MIHAWSCDLAPLTDQIGRLGVWLRPKALRHRVLAVVIQVSRLVVDPELLPDEREEVLAVGMGTV